MVDEFGVKCIYNLTWQKILKMLVQFIETI